MAQLDAPASIDLVKVAEPLVAVTAVIPAAVSSSEADSNEVKKQEEKVEIVNSD